MIEEVERQPRTVLISLALAGLGGAAGNEAYRAIPDIETFLWGIGLMILFGWFALAVHPGGEDE